MEKVIKAVNKNLIGKKDRKKPNTFSEFWKDLIERGRGNERPIKKVVHNALLKISKRVHLTKEEWIRTEAMFREEITARGAVNNQQILPDSIPSSVVAETPKCQQSSIILDVDDAKTMNAHKLDRMLEDVLFQSDKRDAKKGKNPSRMTPDQLVAYRTLQPDDWDTLVKYNTVISYGICKPKPVEIQVAMNRKMSAPRAPLVFEDTVDLIKCPIGEQFDPKEKTLREIATLIRK